MSDTPAIAGFRVVSQDAWEAGLAACEEYRAKLDKLERENAALRADKERLDWMASADYWADIAVYRTPQALRAAIDAARKEAQP